MVEIKRRQAEQLDPLEQWKQFIEEFRDEFWNEKKEKLRQELEDMSLEQRRIVGKFGTVPNLMDAMRAHDFKRYAYLHNELRRISIETARTLREKLDKQAEQLNSLEALLLDYELIKNFSGEVASLRDFHNSKDIGLFDEYYPSILAEVKNEIEKMQPRLEKQWITLRSKTREIGRLMDIVEKNGAKNMRTLRVFARTFIAFKKLSEQRLPREKLELKVMELLNVLKKVLIKDLRKPKQS